MLWILGRIWLFNILLLFLFPVETKGRQNIVCAFGVFESGKHAAKVYVMLLAQCMLRMYILLPSDVLCFENSKFKSANRQTFARWH